jgi:cytochrome c-type biogenesis protein
LVSALTVALAFANTGLLKFLRSGLQHIDRIAAVFVIISGMYLLWYFYWVDVREVGDPVTDWAFARQARATAFLNDHWQVVGLVLVLVVGAAVAYVSLRSAHDDPSEPNGVDHHGAAGGLAVESEPVQSEPV